MVDFHPSNNVIRSSGIGQDIPSRSGLIVDPGIVISSPDNYGVRCAGSNMITCNGTVAGNTGLETGFNSTINIGSSGAISGKATGLVCSQNTAATNAGHVFGGTVGMTIVGGSVVNNSGTILNGEVSGAIYGAVFMNTDSYQKILVNSGTIWAKFATSYAIFSFDSASSGDVIINSGTIKGKVALGGGDDIFINTSGKVVAQNGTTPALIDGGDGEDRFYLGGTVETIKGGTDADTFYFKTAPNKAAIDHIQDFAHGQDHIGLSKSLFKLDPGQTIASAFQDITAGLSTQGTNKHVLYNHDSGALFYDADGKSGAAPVQFATLDNHPLLTSDDILMV